MKSSFASVRSLVRVVGVVVAWSLVVSILAIPVAPQEAGPAQSAGAALAHGYWTPFSAGLATRLAASDSLRNLVDTNTAVVFVFFSSDSSSLFSRGEPHSSDLADSVLGASLTRPVDLEAMLGSTSLVPEAPAWEPIFPNAGFSRLIVFPEWHKRNSQELAEPAWIHNASGLHDYCCLNSAASIVW